MPSVRIYLANKPVDRREIGSETVGAAIDELATQFVKKKNLVFGVDVHLDDELLLPTDENRSRKLVAESALILVQNASGNIYSATEPRIAWLFAI